MPIGLPRLAQHVTSASTQAWGFPRLRRFTVAERNVNMCSAPQPCCRTVSQFTFFLRVGEGLKALSVQVDEVARYKDASSDITNNQQP